MIAPLWNASSVMYSSRNEVTLEEFKECVNYSLIPLEFMAVTATSLLSLICFQVCRSVDVHATN